MVAYHAVELGKAKAAEAEARCNFGAIKEIVPSFDIKRESLAGMRYTLPTQTDGREAETTAPSGPVVKPLP